MNASFEEKSVWIQLLSLLTVLSGYFVVAIMMIVNGATELMVFVPLFSVAVILLVAILAGGHIVAAITSGQQGRDERDQLIAWRAESKSSWILGSGVLLAMVGMVLAIENVWIVHFLLLVLLLSEVVKYIFQILYYRKGL